MKEKKQLIMFSILFGILIIFHSLQVIFNPFSFVKNISLIAVIAFSIPLGAFIRELFILKKKG
ncbi:hypothetical protein [Sutcliffiella halmapala]|uniref:hypothetical protein n=1 Tax=Sutcliffiella halmapala TaxID=79882 RepID=UPI000995475C|nr:hypothetical protein [Sutcliffiella halmapala]